MFSIFLLFYKAVKSFEIPHVAIVHWKLMKIVEIFKVETVFSFYNKIVKILRM